MIKKLKNWLEKKINEAKGIVTWILFIGTVGAMGVVWVGHNNYLEIKSQILLGLELPIAHAQSPNSEDLSVLEGTRMEDAIPYILDASKYYNIPVGVFLGVANAESSFKNFPNGTFNPFGIKPNNSLKGYSSWSHSINGFAQLIKYYYIEEGLDSCQKMMRKYVGYESSDWVNNCNQYYE